MKTAAHFVLLALTVLPVGRLWGQTTDHSAISTGDAPAKRWAFSLTTSGYLVPQGQSYASPIFAADHRWLHLEARYNDEAQRTGSLWAGCNFSIGDKFVFDATPMVGAVFGDTTGIAPGANLALTYKKVELSSQIEYVFATSDKSQSFLYSWNEVVYAPVDWFHAGLVSQRTRAYHTSLDVQRGFSAGFSHKKVDFTTYVFNAGWTDPTVVLVLGLKF